jgi:hypothetical protein
MSGSDISVAKIPRRKSPPSSKARVTPPADNESWLKQFSPVDESLLTARQRTFVQRLRSQYPEGHVGTRGDAAIYFYAIDPCLGRFMGVLPQGTESAPA